VGHWLHRHIQGRLFAVCDTALSSTDAIMQSEEARLEFDKEPGHDKLKVGVPAV
jgi:hypothetical protein